jgi:hypothetical protein
MWYAKFSFLFRNAFAYRVMIELKARAGTGMATKGGTYQKRHQSSDCTIAAIWVQCLPKGAIHTGLHGDGDKNFVGDFYEHLFDPALEANPVAGYGFMRCAMDRARSVASNPTNYPVWPRPDSDFPWPAPTTPVPQTFYFDPETSELAQLELTPEILDRIADELLRETPL